MSSARPAHDGCKIGHEPVDRPTSRKKKREPVSPKGKSMFRKVAIALVAASMLAAPVTAQTPAATDSKPAAAAPSTTTDKSAPSTTVKANKAKSSKHSRAMRNTRTASHKSVMTVKHARHFNAGKSHKVANATKSHKVAGTANKVVSAKSAARHFVRTRTNSHAS